MIRQLISFVTELGALLHLSALKQHFYVFFLSCISRKTNSISKTIALWCNCIMRAWWEKSRSCNIWIRFGEISEVYHVDDGWAFSWLTIIRLKIVKLLEAFYAVLDESDVFIISDWGRKVGLLTLVDSIDKRVGCGRLEFDFRRMFVINWVVCCPLFAFHFYSHIDALVLRIPVCSAVYPLMNWAFTFDFLVNVRRHNSLFQLLLYYPAAFSNA